MIVYGSTLSPYVRKVMAFGAEKGIDARSQPIGAGVRAGEPVRQDAAFSDGVFAISDSTAIITYLDAKFPEPNLIPLEPAARAGRSGMRSWPTRASCPPALASGRASA